ncbi:MAG: TetR/AcrR family transcriptional regulator [Roseiarcus sp.]
MSESPPRPPGRPRSEASRAALLDAAYWQALQRGYAAVTAEEIAKAAGAGKQTLYRWWPSKGRIVLEAFLAKERERIDRPREAAIQAGDLAKFLVAECAGGRPFDAALPFLLAEAQADADLLGAIRREVVEPRAAALRTILNRRVADAERIESLIAAIDGAIWRRLMFGEPLDEAFARGLAALAPAA